MAPAARASSQYQERERKHSKAARSKGKKVRTTQARAMAAFARERSQAVEYCAFVGVLKGGHVYEVWYFDEEWCTSFIVLHANGADEFYEGVQELIQEINLARQLEAESLSLSTDRRIRLWIGAVAFLSSLAIVLRLAWHNPTQSGLTVAAAISVLASGCVAIFGVWVPSPLAGRAVGSAPAKRAASAES